jgi:hypothetical protein
VLWATLATVASSDAPDADADAGFVRLLDALGDDLPELEHRNVLLQTTIDRLAPRSAVYVLRLNNWPITRTCLCPRLRFIDIAPEAVRMKQ